MENICRTGERKRENVLRGNNNLSLRMGWKHKRRKGCPASAQVLKVIDGVEEINKISVRFIYFPFQRVVRCMRVCVCLFIREERIDIR